MEAGKPLGNAMSAAAFDTLSVARDLEAAGFDRPQAEAVATAINYSGAQAATRDDVDQLRASFDQLRASFDQHRAATRDDVDQLRASFDQHRAATKADIDQLRATTKADLDTAVATLRTEIARQETRLTWKALGIAGLIIAAIKLIPSAY